MAYRHSLVLGNNGKVERFNALDGASRTLLNQTAGVGKTSKQKNEWWFIPMTGSTAKLLRFNALRLWGATV
jgi:hypothetical protein